jgi:hypothetical protein
VIAIQKVSNITYFKAKINPPKYPGSVYSVPQEEITRQQMTLQSCNRFCIVQYLMVLILFLTPYTAIAQIEFDESFTRYPPVPAKWDYCQTAGYLNSSVSGQDGLPGTAYRIGIDEFRGTATCICGKREGCLGLTKEEIKFYSEETESDEESELYSISRLPKPDLSQFNRSADGQCKDYTETRVPQKTLVQKNEIRLWKDSWPDAKTGYWVSFRFRLDGSIDRCGSMRWIGGQIKAGDGKKSPVIAQRFDNGVFHITIETPIPGKDDKSKRFIIAKSADGNPDAGSGLQSSNNGEDRFTCDLSNKEGIPKDCEYQGVNYEVFKPLPSVKDGQWVQMDYYIKLEEACKSTKNADCERELEIWSQGEKITAVKGNFGATDAHEKKLKFKFGVYRDFQAGNAGIIIDQLTLRKDPTPCWSPSNRSLSSEDCD